MEGEARLAGPLSPSVRALILSKDSELSPPNHLRVALPLSTVISGDKVAAWILKGETHSDPSRPHGLLLALEP